MDFTYEEETGEVVIEIRAGSTTVEHRVSPDELESIEYKVQRTMAISGVRPRDYMLEGEGDS
ncbi:hypothetical protein [Natrinema pallidum]|uniref:Uncharacterized protein n=1 Tax=Natrinema pallidum TaxID=69527 RepID=A0A4P9TK35_9EURY|nr:hypothetical protein [Natrinema pallidum]QCW05293.1 hypothetical protein FGF80_18810 [Natrinema pallidum]